jgi:hypothetical protein
MLLLYINIIKINIITFQCIALVSISLYCTGQRPIYHQLLLCQKTEIEWAGT